MRAYSEKFVLKIKFIFFHHLFIIRFISKWKLVPQKQYGRAELNHIADPSSRRRRPVCVEVVREAPSLSSLTDARPLTSTVLLRRGIETDEVKLLLAYVLI